MRLFDVAGGKHVRDYAGASGEIVDVATSPDAQHLLASTADGNLVGWKLADAQASGKISTPPVTALAFHSDNKSLVTASGDGVLRVYNWPPVAAVPLAGAAKPLSSLAVSFDNKWVVVAEAEATPRLPGDRRQANCEP